MVLVTKQGFCYLWDQTIGKKGTDEVGSCVFKHLKKYLKDTQVTKVTLIADNCPSQNKSRMTYQILLWALYKIEQLKEVEYIFLEKGHTQNANESIHSNIEQAKKGIEIHHPCQWTTPIQTACLKQPYIVKQLNQDENFD